MRSGSSLLVMLLAAGSSVAPLSAREAGHGDHADVAPIQCDACEEWNLPHAPFRLYGNSYYVGVDGLSSILITTDDGLILLDGGLPQSAPRVADNIRALGFRVQDVRWMGISHAHFDHAGGIAALARMSGAKVVATAEAAEALRAGDAPDDDPQAGFGDEMKFPPVTTPIHVLGDGQTITLGGTTLTLHATPGHTPGGSSWSWKSCEADRCRTLVYADSLTPVSAPGFRFGPAGSARETEFRRSIAKVGGLRCDLMVSAHPGFSQLFERQQRQALLETEGCHNYADGAGKRLDQRLAEEAKARAP